MLICDMSLPSCRRQIPWLLSKHCCRETWIRLRPVEQGRRLLFAYVSSVSIPGLELVIVCGAYVIAWLAGLVTPGAPAGVGIREIVLYAILHPFINEADLLTAIVFGRIITVVGDVLFYILALLIGTRAAKTT